MDARAPAVVAVVVTRDPGPWFEETLSSLAEQHYEEMSVLVMVVGGGDDPARRVGKILPEAFVRRLPDGVGFGAAADEVLGMVEGASYFLLLHDDCALDPDALHVMVEEAYRSNAGIVSPKLVRWDDPRVLLHVGMNADKTGAVVDRVQAGEVDHGQHDAVRDVFVAPSDCVLVRADLFAELGGFDPGMVAMAEDLDLSWRAQVAGARVVVAPGARVRSLQGSGGELRLGPSPEEGSSPPTLQALQRRHELRAVLKCYGPFHLLRVLPQAILLAVGEVLAALVVGDRVRARAVAGAWRWNLARTGELRSLRAELRRHRTVRDAEVRRLQVRGSARLATYASRLTHQGFDVAHGRTPSVLEGATRHHAGSPELLDDAGVPVLTGSVGGAFSEDADFDELDDLGRRSGTDRFGRRRRRRVLASPRSRALAWLGVAAVLVFGTRDLLAGHLPLVGQLLPMESWSGTWRHFVAGWQPAGVGTTAPSTPAFAALGAVGTVLFGAMGLAQKVLVLGCIPLGGWGVARLLRDMASPRARLVAVVCYLGLPLPYDDLARGRWDGLVAYAAVPFVLSRLARSTGLPPFAGGPAAEGARGWRATLPGQMVTLGVIVALAMSFAPAMVVVVPVCAAALVLGSLVVGEWRGSLRALSTAAGATAMALLLCGPWVVGTLAGGNAVSVLGLAASPSASPGWGQLLRFEVGPVGGSVLGWLLVAAALLPLLIARRWRLAWAGRFWAVACASWILAEAVSRGWTATFAPSIDVLLAPAATAVAVGIGLGVAAFETDLSGYRFGWRQVVTGLGVVAVAAGVVPVLAQSFDGRWGLPVSGYAGPLAFTSQGRSSGPYRLLWLGDPRALPLGGWSVEPGLAYATSEGTTPDAGLTWAPAGPGPAEQLARSVSLAMAGRTTELGHLLATAGVRYVVVAASLAPSIAGQTPATAFPPPNALLPALLGQRDLRKVPASQGFSVFENAAPMVPVRAARPGGLVSAGLPADAADLTGWRAVLPGPTGSRSYEGTVPKGTVVASYAPAGRWQLSVGNRQADRSPAFGWAAQFAAPEPGPARLWFAGTVWLPLGLLAQVLLWAAVAAVIAGRRRWLDWWWTPVAARVPRGSRGARGARGARRSRRRGGEA